MNVGFLDKHKWAQWAFWANQFTHCLNVNYRLPPCLPQNRRSCCNSNAAEINLDSGEVESTIKTLAIIRPMDTIPSSHLARLDAFMARGGRLLLAINQVNGDMQRAYGMPASNGLESWLQQKGVTVENAFVVDAKCGSVTVQEQQGQFNFQSRVSFPFLPVVGRFANHPITKGLETVFLQFASPVYFVGDTSKRFTPLIFSPKHMG